MAGLGPAELPVRDAGHRQQRQSLYVGDWSYVHVGIRLSPPVQIIPTGTRYIDKQMMSWLSRFRGSIRLVHPGQTVCRLEGIL